MPTRATGSASTAAKAPAAVSAHGRSRVSGSSRACGRADPVKRIIFYCGGGIAATLDAFLLHQLGYQEIAVDGNSLGERAKDETLPTETD